MRLTPVLLLIWGAALGACAAPSQPRPVPGDAAFALESGHPPSLPLEGQAGGMPERASPRPRGGPWAPGQAVLQGFLGAYVLDEVGRSGGNQVPVDGSDEELAQLPAIGGGGQWKLAGERLDLGFEGMFSVGWRANAEAFAVGGGGAVVAVDADLLLLDIYGGPFVSLFLGERWRVYAAAGPMMTWADYDQTGAGGTYDDSGSGFGTGWYARTGLELVVQPGLMIGAGVRWSDSTIDLGSGLGDLDVEGLQWALTVSTGI
jgi:hypothetical protein